MLRGSRFVATGNNERPARALSTKWCDELFPMVHTSRNPDIAMMVPAACTKLAHGPFTSTAIDRRPQ